MIATRPAWSRLLRRELLILYLVIFLADTTVGYILPLFPLLALQLGASITLIGSLTAINGGTQVLVAVPLGMISDRFGRRRLITFGLLCFSVAAGLLAVAPTPFLLIPAQFVLGVGTVATFYLAAALVGDYSRPEERGLAIGLLTTAMGLGFAAGPLVGGLVSERMGIQNSLYAVMGIALAGFVLAWRCLSDVPAPAVRSGSGRNIRCELRLLVSNRAVMLAALAHLLLSPIFNGVVLSLVPIKADLIGFSALTIGTLFTVRALSSTATRLPIGALSTPAWSDRLMLLALALGGVALAVIAAGTSPPTFYAALAVEGISYGMFLTAGQAFVTQYAPMEQRGAALGAYNMAGGIGAALSPIALGILADTAGLNVSLWVTAILALGGAIILLPFFEQTTRELAPKV
jgi:DHA1 family multidrug resistance protein-like MFS transporter